MTSNEYIYVWDHDKRKVVVSYFVLKEGMKSKDFPKDTSKGGIPENGLQDFLEILKRTYPPPRYRICGGISTSLDFVVDNYFGLADKDYNFEGDRDYLCVWNKKRRKVVECYLVSDSDANGENLPKVPSKFQYTMLEQLKQKYSSDDFYVIIITTSSLKKAEEVLKTWPL